MGGCLASTSNGTPAFGAAEELDAGGEADITGTPTGTPSLATASLLVAMGFGTALDRDPLEESSPSLMRPSLLTAPVKLGLIGEDGKGGAVPGGSGGWRLGGGGGGGTPGKANNAQGG